MSGTTLQRIPSDQVDNDHGGVTPGATYRVLITGCGRSGTRYAAKLLAGLRLNVRHEEFGSDGAASWCMAVDADAVPWGSGRRGCRFTTVLHQVRHPLRVIPSLTTFSGPSWDFIARHIDCPPSDPAIVRGAKYWFYWNRLAERYAQWTYRVEHLPAVYDEFCHRLGVPVDRRVLERTSTKVNSRRRTPLLRTMQRVFDKLGYAPRSKRLDFLYSDRATYHNCPFTWDELERLAPGWSAPVLEEARRYGYTKADDDAAIAAVASAG